MLVSEVTESGLDFLRLILLVTIFLFVTLFDELLDLI